MKLSVFNKMLLYKNIKKSVIFKFIPLKIKYKFFESANKISNYKYFAFIYFTIKFIMISLIVYLLLFNENQYIESVNNLFNLTFSLAIIELFVVLKKIDDELIDIRRNHFFRLSNFKNGKILKEIINYYIIQSIINTFIPFTLYFFILVVNNYIYMLLYFLCLVCVFLILKLTIKLFYWLSVKKLFNDYMLRNLIKIILFLIVVNIFIYPSYEVFSFLDIDLFVFRSNPGIKHLYIALVLMVLCIILTISIKLIKYNVLARNLWNGEITHSVKINHKSKAKLLSMNTRYIRGLDYSEQILMKKDLLTFYRKEKSKLSAYIIIVVLSVIFGCISLIASSDINTDMSVRMLIDMMFIFSLVFLCTWFLYILKDTTWYSSEKKNLYLLDYFKIDKYTVLNVKTKLNFFINLPIIIIFNSISAFSFYFNGINAIPEIVFRLLFSYLLLNLLIVYTIYKDANRSLKLNISYETGWIGNSLNLVNYLIIFSTAIYLFVFINDVTILDFKIGLYLPIVYLIITGILNMYFISKTKKMKKVRVTEGLI